MSHLKIADIDRDRDFFEDLTLEELESCVCGGATAAGSVSAGKYVETNGTIDTTALTATVAISDSHPFRIDLIYSLEPQLFVAVGTSPL